MSFIATESSDSSPSPEPVPLHPLQPPPRPGSGATRSSRRSHATEQAGMVASTSRLSGVAGVASGGGGGGSGLPRTSSGPVAGPGLGLGRRVGEWETVGEGFGRVSRSAKGKGKGKESEAEVERRVKEERIEAPIDSFRPRPPTRPGSAAAAATSFSTSTPAPPPELKPLATLQPHPPFPAQTTRRSSRSHRPPSPPLPDPPKKRVRPSTPPPRPRSTPVKAESPAPGVRSLRPPTLAPVGPGPGSAQKATPISLASRTFKLPGAGIGQGTVEAKLEEEAKQVAGGARSLGALRPKVPEGGRWDDGDAAEKEWTEQLSPRKKKGGYLMHGLAARAAEVFARTRTEHTFWLSKLSRMLAERDGKKPLTPWMLAKLTAPDMKVEVLEVLTDRAGGRRTRGAGAGLGGAPPGSPRKRGVRRQGDDKLVLARCRLLIGLTAAASSGPDPGGRGGAQKDEAGEEEDDDEVHGIVAFSLHLHPAATATTASSSTGAGAPPVLPPPASKHSSEKRAAASLFLPSQAHDLRFLRAGVEVWVWGPYEEVVVGGGETGGKGKTDGEGDGMGSDGDRAEGQSGEEEEGREAVALVCSRFAVLV